MNLSRKSLPRWIEIGAIPVVNVSLAFLIAGLIVWSIGADPLEAVRILLYGALRSATSEANTKLRAQTTLQLAGARVDLSSHLSQSDSQLYLSGKLLRRSIQALAEGRDPGDLTTIEDPGALEQISLALARERGTSE